jgi:hypothetical protein
MDDDHIMSRDHAELIRVELELEQCRLELAECKRARRYHNDESGRLYAALKIAEESRDEAVKMLNELIASRGA